MKLILASTLATATIAFAANPPVGGEVIVSPLTAVVITECNDLISVIITMPDGTLRHFGISDGLSHDEALRLAEKASRTIQVRIKCPTGEESST